MMGAQEKSRSDELLEEVKARRWPWQFGILGLLGMVSVIGVWLAAPRVFGISYEVYFSLLALILYGCTPLVCWTLLLTIPKSLPKTRAATVVTVAAALVVPWLVLWANAGADVLRTTVTATLLIFWLPQVLCIAAVYSLFHSG